MTELENVKTPDVIKLKLFLPIEGLETEGVDILKKYGKAQEGVIREVLVPASITLHALHYLINRAFGWRNSHMHRFVLPFEIFQEITDGTSLEKQGDFLKADGLYVNWVKLCGVYFRFPFDDIEGFYWDDDYDGRQNPKTWMKKKYTGPYMDLGKKEGYKVSRKAAAEVIKKNPKVLKAPDFMAMNKGKKIKNEYVPVEKASISDVSNMFMGDFESLLERLRLSQLLRISDGKKDENLFKLVDELAKKQEKSKEELPVIPVTNALFYEYDFGDGWVVVVKAEEFYDVEEGSVVCNNKQVDEELAQKIITVINKLKPICVSMDGLPVMDDVGGIWGYIDFLKNIHEGDKEEREESREWAKEMGWSGRMPKMDTLL